jgi:hypothetical protein
MAIKIPTSSVAKPSKIYQNLDFWFEKIPSDNTALCTYMYPGRILPHMLTIGDDTTYVTTPPGNEYLFRLTGVLHWPETAYVHSATKANRSSRFESFQLERLLEKTL